MGAGETVPCKTCGDPTEMLGTKLCDPCWEVEHGLEAYLRRGGQKALGVLQLALDERAQGIRLVQAVRHTEARDEAEHAAALWLRLVTLWESAEEGELHDKLVTLMEEWKGEAPAVDTGELIQAAKLWERLMSIWESDDGTPTKAHDHEILERIALLVDEWQGFVGKTETDPALAFWADPDSAFEFIASEGYADEYNAWCADAPERSRRESLFGEWQADRKAAKAALGCTHPDSQICQQCKQLGGFSKWFAQRKKAPDAGGQEADGADAICTCGHARGAHLVFKVACEECGCQQFAGKPGAIP